MMLEILNMVFFTAVFLFFFCMIGRSWASCIKYNGFNFNDLLLNIVLRGSIPIILFWLSVTPKTYTNIGILIAVSVIGIAVGCLTTLGRKMGKPKCK